MTVYPVRPSAAANRALSGSLSEHHSPCLNPCSHTCWPRCPLTDPGTPPIHSISDQVELTRSIAQIMHRETVRDVADLTGAAITTRGVYVPPGHRLPEGERKLYLLIQVRADVSLVCERPSGHRPGLGLFSAFYGYCLTSRALSSNIHTGC